MTRKSETTREKPNTTRLAGSRVILGLLIILLAGGLYVYPQLIFLAHGKLSPIQTDPVEFEVSLEGLRFVGTTGNLIDDLVYYTGNYEGFELHALRDFLVATAGSDGVFLDIGANIGVHSLYMSRYAKEVVSIEPYPLVLERFQKMKELNNIDNIRICPVGYSNKEGELPFFAPPESNLGTGSFDAEFSGKNRLAGHLPLVIGDEHLVEESIERVDLIKVDIEGYERYALLGLVETLSSNRPIVVFELNIVNGGFRSRGELLQTFPENYEFYYLGFDLPEGMSPYYLTGLGSYVYVYGPGVPAHYTLKPYDFSFRHQANLVAMPSEKASKLGLRD